MNFIFTKNIVFKKNFKKLMLFILNAICFSVLFYNAIDMTFDYLKFEFTYKLIVVDDNKEGFDLPEISVCTENNVLFAKTKVIQYFDVDNEWKTYRIEVKKLYEQIENGEIKEMCINGLENYYFEGNQLADRLKWRIKFCSDKFFVQYKKMLFNEMCFYEMNSMTFNANELFDCSANIRFVDPNITNIDNCFDRLSTLKSIYVNEDFGICYTFFSVNNKILLKDNDYINIKIKFEKQKDFMIVERSIDIFTVFMNSLRYFVWYVMVSDRHSSNRETAIELNKVGFDARISFEMTSIQLLSTPYMDYCVKNGNYITISVTNLFFNNQVLAKFLSSTLNAFLWDNFQNYQVNKFENQVFNTNLSSTSSNSYQNQVQYLKINCSWSH